MVDQTSGKERPVDYDAVRAMHIRGIRERVAVTLQSKNATIIRVWASACFVAAGAGGALEAGQ